MNKNIIMISALSIILIAIIYSILINDEEISNDIQGENLNNSTKMAISKKEEIEKKENKINNTNKDNSFEIDNIEEEIQPDHVEESYEVKTIYSMRTTNRKYEISLTSEQDISSKPLSKKYDSGVIVNENIIVYGNIDDNTSYRMLFGKDIVDNANDITFIVKIKNNEEIEEIAPTFLYSIDQPGQYQMDIQTSPLSFSEVQYIKPKHDMKRLIEGIQLKIQESKNTGGKLETVKELPRTLKSPQV